MVTTDSGQSPLLLVEVLEILHDQKIDYAVIGALAASYYGAARTSMMLTQSCRWLSHLFKA